MNLAKVLFMRRASPPKRAELIYYILRLHGELALLGGLDMLAPTILILLFDLRWRQGRNAWGDKTVGEPAASEVSKIFTDHTFQIGLKCD